MNRVISTKQFLFRQIEVLKASSQCICVLSEFSSLPSPCSFISPHNSPYRSKSVINLELPEHYLTNTPVPSGHWPSTSSGIMAEFCLSGHANLHISPLHILRLSLWILFLFYISPWIPWVSRRLPTARQMDYPITQTRSYYSVLEVQIRHINKAKRIHSESAVADN